MSRPRVLFLTPAPPWPADSGGRIRTSQLIERAGREASITLFSVSAPGTNAPPPASLLSACERVEVFDRTRPGLLTRLALSRLERSFHSNELNAAVGRELAAGAHDLVHVDELSVSRALGASSSTPTLIHHHKLDARLAAEQSALGLGVTDGEVAKVHALERLVSRTHDFHAACSTEEARSLEERHGVCCAVVPNGVDETHFAPSDSAPDPATILFLGTLSYEPNVHGLEWFVSEVLPLLRGARPEVRLKIVGIDPSPRVLALGGEDVEVVGPVPDPLAHLHSATCSIAPLFLGGGTRIKILESLAAGCPVVSTGVGAEGLELPLEAISIADEARTFSAALLRVLADPIAARERARGASAIVRARYSWEASASALLGAWESCCAKTPA